MKRLVAVTTLYLTAFCSPSPLYAQEWTIGGNMGLSTFDGYTGLQIAPMAELAFNRSMAIGAEFSLNTQSGLPLQLYPYFKYFIAVPNSAVRPYVNGGPVMTLNIPGSPSFGILFGGGVNIPLARGLSLAPDLLFGPLFGVGGGQYPFILTGYYWGYQTYGLLTSNYPSSTVFAFSVRCGIRYEL